MMVGVQLRKGRIVKIDNGKAAISRTHYRTAINWG